MIPKPTQPKPATSMFAAAVFAGILASAMIAEAQETPANTTPVSAADAEIIKKLSEMIVPSLEFSDTPLSDAINFLRARCEELDTTTKDAAKKGVNILVVGEDTEDILITLKLKNIPMLEALRYTATIVGGKMSIKRSVVVIELGKGTAAEGAPELTAEQRKAGIKKLKEKLSSIQIPSLDLKNTPFREVLAFLQQRSMELDPEKDPAKKGINIVLEDGELANVEVTLRLKNLSLGDALYFCCAKAGLEYAVEPGAVVISQKKGDKAQ